MSTHPGSCIPPGAEQLTRAAPRAGAAAPDLQLRKAVQTSQSAEGFLLKEMSDGKPVSKCHSPEKLLRAGGRSLPRAQDFSHLRK